MRGIIPARCPNKKDNSFAPHTEALQPHFAVVLTIVLHRNHREIENRLKICEIDAVFSEIDTALRLLPSDHEQNVDAKYSSVKRNIDALQSRE